MRRLIAVALVVAGAAIPACAQRGGGGRGGGVGHSSGFASRGGSLGPSGGFASHSAPAFHGSFAPVTRPSTMGAMQFRASQYAGSYRRPGRPVGAGIPTNSGIDRGLRPPYRYERGYVPFYGTGLAYSGAIGPDCFSFGDCDAYDSASYSGPAAPDVNSYAYAQGAPAYASGPEEGPADSAQIAAYRPAYQRPAPPPEPEQAVTLVFKDGRPPEQIHNYMLTRTTLYVQDERHREVAVGDLDLAATEKANKDAGMAFQLPGTQSGL